MIVAVFYLSLLTLWINSCFIKADRPLTRDTLNAPWLLTNRQFQWTGNGHLQFWLNSASRVLMSTFSAPLVQTGERKQPHTVWPWPLTYDLHLQSRLAKVKSTLMPKIKVKGQTVQTGERPQTNGRTHTHTHTHGRYQTYYLPCYAVDKYLYLLFYC